MDSLAKVIPWSLDSVTIDAGFAEGGSLSWSTSEIVEVVPRRAAGIRTDLRRGSFWQLVSLAQALFGQQVAQRLESLHKAPLEPGEHRLRVKSLRHALRFAIDHAWPLASLYSTPSGDIQLVWQLVQGNRLAARFSPDGTVEFAAVGLEGIQLTGRYPLNKFAAVVESLRADVIDASDVVPYPIHFAEHVIGDPVHTEWEYRGQVLSAEGPGPGRQSFWSGVSASTGG